MWTHWLISLILVVVYPCFFWASLCSCISCYGTVSQTVITHKVIFWSLLLIFHVSVVLKCDQLFYFYRRNKSNQSTKILINMFVALFTLNLSFLSNESMANTRDSSVCTVIALIMHYSMLSTFTWFFLQALHMYFWLIRQNISMKNYMKKMIVSGWGELYHVIKSFKREGENTQTLEFLFICFQFFRVQLLWSLLLLENTSQSSLNQRLKKQHACKFDFMCHTTENNQTFIFTVFYFLITGAGSQITTFTT